VVIRQGPLFIDYPTYEPVMQAERAGLRADYSRLSLLLTTRNVSLPDARPSRTLDGPPVAFRVVRQLGPSVRLGMCVVLLIAEKGSSQFHDVDKTLSAAMRSNAP
jgi:hypothetical protein